MKPADDGMRADEPLTEIVIHPDGRVYVHGLSRGVVEVLAALQPGDPRLRQILARVGSGGGASQGEGRG